MALAYDSSTDAYKVNMVQGVLTTGDLEIGAVEIKNATDDTRAVVGANGLYTDVRNIQAGANYIGLASVNIGGTLPALSAGVADIGFATVTPIVSSYTNKSIVSNVTVNLKSGAGVFHSININGTSAPTINIWDSLTPSGTLIDRILPNAPRQTYFYDVAFGTGLTVEPLPGDVVVPIQVSYK